MDLAARSELSVLVFELGRLAKEASSRMLVLSKVLGSSRERNDDAGGFFAARTKSIHRACFDLLGEGLIMSGKGIKGEDVREDAHVLRGALLALTENINSLIRIVEAGGLS